MTIYENSFTKRSFSVKAECDILQSPVLFEFGEDYVIIKRASLDDTKGVRNMTHINSGWYQTAFTSELPKGKYVSDEEESTIDQLVFYLE